MSGSVELITCPLIKDFPFNGSLKGDIHFRCVTIRNLFKESQRLSKQQRHDCFAYIDYLRNRLLISPETEYMYREVYLRQAEKVLNRTSPITDPITLSKLDPLARRYISAFSNFQNLMQNYEFSFSDLKREIQNLTDAHNTFSSQFAHEYELKFS